MTTMTSNRIRRILASLFSPVRKDACESIQLLPKAAQIEYIHTRLLHTKEVRFTLYRQTYYCAERKYRARTEGLSRASHPCVFIPECIPYSTWVHESKKLIFPYAATSTIELLIYPRLTLREQEAKAVKREGEKSNEGESQSRKLTQTNSKETHLQNAGKARSGVCTL